MEIPDRMSLRPLHSNLTSRTVSFIDATNHDYRLSISDTDRIDFLLAGLTDQTLDDEDKHDFELVDYDKYIKQDKEQKKAETIDFDSSLTLEPLEEEKSQKEKDERFDLILLNPGKQTIRYIPCKR